MKRRTIRLVFHVGRGKTGTKFLQSNAEKIPEVYFFGKYYSKLNNQTRGLINDKGNNEFVGELNKIHNRLFRSFRSESNSGFANPSRNSTNLLDDYVNILCEVIRNEKRKKVFIISDECISDYSNYLGEWSTLLVAAIGNSLSKQLESEFVVEKILSLTIRAQPDLLLASYGYDRMIRSSENFSKWLERKLSAPEDGLCGGLFYFSCYSLYRSVFDNSWKVIIVPFEIMTVDGDGGLYLRKAFCLDEKFDFSKCDLSTRVNANSRIDGAKKKTIYRKFNIFIRVGFKLRLEHNRAVKMCLRNGFYLSFIFHGSLLVVAIVLSNLGKIINRLFFNRKERYCYLDEDSCLKIIKTFQSDNKKLVDIIGLEDLKRFGYL